MIYDLKAISSKENMKLVLKNAYSYNNVEQTAN